MIKNRTGVWGEHYAARYMREKNFDIICRNYVCRFGELDIVAQKDGLICIVEVKTRSENALISPMEAVDSFKRERLESAAKNFLSFTKMSGAIRFDVCEVLVDNNNIPVRINYIENAF